MKPAPRRTSPDLVYYLPKPHDIQRTGQAHVARRRWQSDARQDVPRKIRSYSMLWRKKFWLILGVCCLAVFCCASCITIHPCATNGFRLFQFCALLLSLAATVMYVIVSFTGSNYNARKELTDATATVRGGKGLDPHGETEETK